MDSGTRGGEGTCKDETAYIQAYMETVGYEVDKDVAIYVDKGGQHSETYWGPRFHIPMEFLYPSGGVPIAPPTSETLFM